jgi:3-methyladenine DNA glycosylase AlkD
MTERVDDDFVLIMSELEQLADPAWKAKLAHFGSRPGKALGVSMADIRALAKGRKSHELALKLWDSGIHEARLLATMVEDPKLVTREQTEVWVRDFDAWDICDGACGNLFWKLPWIMECALAWCREEEEYVRRAGFVMMAVLTLREKKAGDDYFEPFFPLMLACAGDERNFVKKAVNWALRQIGKRKNSPALRARAIQTAEEMLKMQAPSARWIARDALKELLGKKGPEGEIL